MKKIIKFITIIILLILFLLFSVNVNSEQNEKSTDLFMKKIINKENANLTVYWIETDLNDNYVIIYGNEPIKNDTRGYRSYDVYISKFTKVGQIIWDNYFSNDWYSFGILDVQIDSQNNIHIVSFDQGWCGNEPRNYEYTKLSPNGEELFHESYDGDFIQMRLYEDNSVGILSFDDCWYNYEELDDKNMTGKMYFYKISNKTDKLISMYVYFYPKGFLIKDSNSIIILSNSTWELSLSGNLIYLSNLTGSYLVNGNPISKDNYFIFKGNYEIKLMKLNNDFKKLEINRTLLTYHYKEKHKITVTFNRNGLISLMHWNNGSINITLIEPVNNSTKSSTVNINGKILRDNTFSLNNTEIFVLSDGNMTDYEVVNVKNIYLASKNIQFKIDGTTNQEKNHIENNDEENNSNLDIDNDVYLDSEDDYPNDQDKWKKEKVNNNDSQEIDYPIIIMLVIIIIIFLGIFYLTIFSIRKKDN